MVANCGKRKDAASERPLNTDRGHRQRCRRWVTFGPQPGMIEEFSPALFRVAFRFSNRQAARFHFQESAPCIRNTC